jgi:lipoprotein-anchoring transpeptidase ErfK/SrfK
MDGGSRHIRAIVASAMERFGRIASSRLALDRHPCPEGTEMLQMTRRLFAAGLPVALSGCAPGLMARRAPRAAIFRRSGAAYGEIEDDGYDIPAVDTARIDPSFLRQEVAYSGHEGPGTLIVDPASRHLLYVEGGGRATRYGVGVGRQGFAWSGIANVRRKSEWPNWTPPSQMIRRQPELEEFADGMPGGLDNPLGARAMYLYQGDRDTLYRIHGTNEPESIGTRVSSGCIRLINQDVIDLYDRVHIGSKVVVLANSVS